MKRIMMYFILKGNEIVESFTDPLKATVRCQILNDHAGRKEYRIEKQRLL